MSKQIEVKVPASTANLGPGFDCMGMAFRLYLKVSVCVADQLKIENHSPGHEQVPVNEENLIYRMMVYVYEKAGCSLPPVHISVESDIPLTRGLGSSASAIVAGLFAGNALLGDHFSREELYHMATAIEDHPDNVGASIYGNIVVATWDKKQVQHALIAPPDPLRVIAIIPDYDLPTEQSRDAVPVTVDRQEAIYNISRSALLVTSLMSGQLFMLKHALGDQLHQPYRAQFIPGMETLIEEMPAHGALGVVLSGAGPTMLALCTDEKMGEVHQYLQQFFAHQPYGTTIRELPIDRQGVQVEVTTPVPY